MPQPVAGQPRTEREIVALIGQLKRSQDDRQGCGKRLIAWYETLLAGLRGRR